MFWLFRCALAVAAIYWLSPVRTQDPAGPSVAELRALAEAAGRHPDTARLLAGEAVAQTVAGIRARSVAGNP